MKINLLFAAPEFFAAPPAKLVLEENAGTGRGYVVLKGRIVAVAVPL